MNIRFEHKYCGLVPSYRNDRWTLSRSQKLTNLFFTADTFTCRKQNVTDNINDGFVPSGCLSTLQQWASTHMNRDLFLEYRNRWLHLYVFCKEVAQTPGSWDHQCWLHCTPKWTRAMVNIITWFFPLWRVNVCHEEPLLELISHLFFCDGKLICLYLNCHAAPPRTLKQTHAHVVFWTDS